MASTNINLRLEDLIFLIENQTDTNYSNQSIDSIVPIVNEHGMEYELESKWICSGEDMGTQQSLAWFQLRFVDFCNQIYIFTENFKNISFDDPLYLEYTEILNNLMIEKEVCKSKIISLI
jgi:hypothetical protein|tara:strand:+ start:139 stop:498 length:360 start_codon:yes stop_codon:yes gene_type:complete